MLDTTSEKIFNKNYLHQYISVCAVSLTFFITGTQLGYLSPCLVILEIDGYNQMLPIKDTDKSTIIMCLSFGIIPGAIWASYINDLIGRKYSIMLIFVPQILCQIFVYFATHVYMFCISEFLRGFCVAWAFSAVPIYISEISSPHLRGPFTVCCIVLQQVGNLVGSMIQSTLSIDQTAIVCSTMSTIVLPMLKLQRIENVDKQYEEMKLAWIESQTIKKASWLKLFTVPLNLKLFLICAGVQTAQQMTGQLYMVSNVHSIIHNSALELSLATISIVINTVGIVAALLGIYLIEQWGRKPLFMIICSGSFIGHSMTAIAFLVEDIQSEKSVLCGSIEFAGIIIYKAMIGVGFQHLPNILASELFATEVKSKGTSMLMLISSLLGAGSTQIFTRLYGISGYVAFFSMASVAFCALIFGYFLVPETKNRSLLEIQNEFKKKKNSGHNSSVKNDGNEI
ncbi:sugar transporter ERD6-like 5 [Chrysoperla carnea]|uniref:sugar transporter ERD6-like 5 n=1 Tax=Chrysoperla carnea TaxID=189513 RepID=UPI001D092F0D|nr:sugar transporter ERD6-like 5 [Chrysoperla carnea]